MKHSAHIYLLLVCASLLPLAFFFFHFMRSAKDLISQASSNRWVVQWCAMREHAVPEWEREIRGGRRDSVSKIKGLGTQRKSELTLSWRQSQVSSWFMPPQESSACIMYIARSVLYWRTGQGLTVGWRHVLPLNTEGMPDVSRRFTSLTECESLFFKTPTHSCPHNQVIPAQIGDINARAVIPTAWKAVVKGFIDSTSSKNVL